MSLQRDIKKRNPFESPHQEAILNILRSADQFQNAIIRLLRPYKITPSQYNVLRILAGEDKPLPSLEIASRLIQVVPAITGLIDRLERAGFVERNRCDLDRRVVYVSITETGKELLETLSQPVNSLHLELLGHMPQDDLRQLSNLLEKARHPGDSDSTNSVASHVENRTASNS